MTTRLFVALVPPAEAIAHLDAAVRRDDVLRWVAPERWHLTLEFVGAGDAGEVAARWQGRVRGVAPMDLALRSAGQFGGRVLWVGLDGAQPQWTSLAGDEQQPHLTIARSRKPADLRPYVRQLSGYAGPTWTATEVVLFDSRLGGAPDGGTQYEVVERFRLRGSLRDGR